MKQNSLKQSACRFFSLLIRPFIDFYYNYGLTRASVLSYVLCANLIIFVYIFMTIGVTVTIDPLVSASSTRRFLELHFLWPMPEKVLIGENHTAEFGMLSGMLVSQEKYDEALSKYCKEKNKNIAILKEEGKLQTSNFSITAELGKAMHEATRTFYDRRSNIHPLGVGFFIIIAIAYFALLLNIKTNLAESVSPLIWGNLPLAHRGSEIMKILWRIPSPNAIKSRVYLFFMLPLLITLTIALISTAQKFIDLLMETYSPVNIALTATFSTLITAVLFTTLYELHVSGISKKNAAIGALIAAALWLGGRWFFTTYGAVSLHRNLRNFAFIPIFLTWFYYFCTVFLFGLYVAQTLENPNLSSTARSWAMRDLSVTNRYGLLSIWMRMDFLYRLALSHYEEYRPPFICINVKQDTADEIAKNCNQSPVFVRECILEMIARHRRAFIIEIEGNRQYCRLKSPPDEVDILPLLTDPEEIRKTYDETAPYEFGNFIMMYYSNAGYFKPIMLSDVYRAYKNFQEHRRSEAPIA